MIRLSVGFYGCDCGDRCFLYSSTEQRTWIDANSRLDPPEATKVGRTDPGDDIIIAAAIVRHLFYPRYITVVLYEFYENVVLTSWSLLSS